MFMPRGMKFLKKTLVGHTAGRVVEQDNNDVVVATCESYDGRSNEAIAIDIAYAVRVVQTHVILPLEIAEKLSGMLHKADRTVEWNKHEERTWQDLTAAILQAREKK
jgi:hypothetical protein